MRPFWRHYYAGTSGVIFVVDSSDHERLEKVKAELHAVMQEEELEFSCCAYYKISLCSENVVILTNWILSAIFCD